MTIFDLYIFGFFAIIGCFVWQHVNISRVARNTARMQCEKQHLLLLDQSVILLSLRLRKSKRSLFCIERRYGFEFTSTGEQRYHGELSFSGKHLTNIDMQAHRI